MDELQHPRRDADHARDSPAPHGRDQTESGQILTHPSLPFFYHPVIERRWVIPTLLHIIHEEFIQDVKK